jgi:hypothetical protein
VSCSGIGRGAGLRYASTGRGRVSQINNRNMLNNTKSDESTTESSIVRVSAENFQDAEEKYILSENVDSATRATVIVSSIAIEDNYILSSIQPKHF